jgi:hypothetical protein
LTPRRKEKWFSKPKEQKNDGTPDSTGLKIIDKCQIVYVKTLPVSVGHCNIVFLKCVFKISLYDNGIEK